MSDVVNPARLKLALLRSGVALDSADGEKDAAAPNTVDILLPGDMWVTAKVAQSSPLTLVRSPGVSAIRHQGGETAVRIASFGSAASRVVTMRSTWATVMLSGGCGQSAAGRTCAFCRGRELTEHAGEVWPIESVVAAVRAAFDQGDAELVHLVLGYFPGDDAGLHVLRPYLEAIHRHFDTMVALTMHPPADLRMVDLTYAEGVDVICYNLEAAGAESMRRHFPGRARYLGRKRYLSALARAAQIFPGGAVWSDLLLDISPRAEIDAAVAELVAAGVLPTFGVLDPEGGADAPALDDSVAIAAAAFHAASHAGIGLGWMRDVSSTFTPFDARYLVSGAPQSQSLLHQLSRNRLGALTTRSLARMRRRLRVRRVRASFDSSHL